MKTDAMALGSKTAGFGVAAAVTVLFNTVLACVKDASPALLRFMNSIAGHNWTTQGLADVLLFFGLGLILSKTRGAATMRPERVIFFLVAAVVVAGLGLFGWYLLF